MALRKVTTVVTIESLEATVDGQKTTDYESDKTFVNSRLGIGGSMAELNATIQEDDVNRKLTVTYIQEDWQP